MTMKADTLIHKAEYMLPGVFLHESTTRVLDARSPQLAAALAPDHAFCFTLFDVATPPDLGPDFKVLPVAQNKSGRYYLGGTIYTLAEVEAMGDDNRILASNMRSNHWDRMIHCRTGTWQPFEDDDTLLEM